MYSEIPPILWSVLTALLAPVAAPPSPNLSTPREVEALIFPVLMYHHIREPGPGMADRLNQRFSVSASEFAKQLDHLQSRGYTTINCRTLAAAVSEGKCLPDKPVMLTFDDAWREQYTIAFPLLQQRGMVGVFFAHTGVLSDQPDSASITWAELCEMKSAGMDIQSHTVSHPSLPGLDPATLSRELAVSKAMLDAFFGEECIAIAYPFGDFTRREMLAAQHAGYRLAVTTEVGLTHHQPFAIGRTIITSADNLDDFDIKLTERDGARTLLDYQSSITPSQPAPEPR